MKRTLFVLALLAASVACYDAKSPNLPPCGDDAIWPDPCAAAARDAGRG